MVKADVLLDIPGTGTLGVDAIGAEAIDRAAYLNTNLGAWLYAGAAPVAGYITKIEIWMYSACATMQIGTAYAVPTNVYSSRDYAHFGAVAAGSKQTLTTDVDGNPLRIRVEAGDLLGIRTTGSGVAIEAAPTGGDGVYGCAASPTFPFNDTTFYLTANYIMSLKGYISTEYPFMLASDKQGNLAWGVSEAPLLRPGQAMGEVSYADVPPEQELTWDGQYSMHGGFGQLDWRDPTRFFTSSGVDTRFRGKAFCGPLLIKVEQASGANLMGLNGPMYCGCDHEKATYIGAGHGVYQTIRPWTLTTVADTKIATAAAPAGDHNDTITLSGTGSPTWDTDILTAGRRIKITGSTSNDGLKTVVSCTSTVLTVYEGLNAETEPAGTTFTTDIWALVWDAGSGIINGLVSSNGYIYACNKILAGAAYYYSDTGNNSPSWTGASGGTVDYDFFLPLNGNIWGFRGRNLANVATVSPAIGGASFSGAYKIGDTSYDFTWALNHRDILLAGKEDGLYSIDEYGNTNCLIPDMRLQSTPLNFRRMFSWKNMVYCPIGPGGLWVWSENNAVDDLSPRKSAPHDTNFHGTVGGLAGDANWLYAVVQGSASGSNYNIGLLAGAWITDELGTRWVWHPLTSWVDDAAHMCFVIRFDVDYNTRLWIGRGTAAATGQTYDYVPNYITLPRYTDNPLEAVDDAATAYAYHYASGGTLTTSWWDKGLRDMTAAFPRLTVWGEDLANVDPGGDAEEQRYITVDYQIEGSSWVLAATSGFTLAAALTQNGVAVSSTFSLPDSALGKRIRLRFNFYTTLKVAGVAQNPVKTPVLLLPFALRAIPAPESRRQIACTIECKDDQAGHLSAAEIRTALNTAKTTAWPCRWTGPMGDIYWGKIQSPTPLETNVRRDDNGKLVSQIQVQVLEAKLA